MNKYTKKGFTLAEVMIALLLIAVILAASTPIITRNTVRTKGGAGNNPWEWINNSTSAVFNKNGRNVTAIIGSGTIPPEELVNSPYLDPLEPIPVLPPPRLVINTYGVTKPISFYQEANKKGDIFVSNKGCFLGNYADLSDRNVENVVAIGNIPAYNSNSVAIGNNVSASAINSIGIGYNTVASNSNAIAIGPNAIASGNNSIAIGSNATANAANATAIGANSIAAGVRSLSLGHLANTFANNAIAIGYNTNSASANSILIGHNTTTSSYSNSIIISSTVSTGPNYMNGIVFFSNTYSPATLNAKTIKANSISATNCTQSSDSRLKNIGTPYTSGMDKLNQLKIYNYTFKSDPKRKRVGVIAQDLMKIFPDAVSKDEDGYYLIRQEDIFYSMVNAVKELNKKISAIIESLKNPSEKSVALAEKINVLETEIKQQKADIRNLKRRVFILKLKTLAWK